MQISCKRNVREIEGKPVHIYTLTNKNGMEVKITNYGGIILSACVPDRCGKLGDVILGYDDIDEYIRTRTVHGSMVGRYANRIGKATFKIKFNKKGTFKTKIIFKGNKNYKATTKTVKIKIK